MTTLVTPSTPSKVCAVNTSSSSPNTFAIAGSPSETHLCDVFTQPEQTGYPSVTILTVWGIAFPVSSICLPYRANELPSECRATLLNATVASSYPFCNSFNFRDFATSEKLSMFRLIPGLKPRAATPEASSTTIESGFAVSPKSKLCRMIPSSSSASSNRISFPAFSINADAISPRSFVDSFARVFPPVAAAASSYFWRVFRIAWFQSPANSSK